MELGLKGRKVIVTGGSRGLGRAALEQFAAEGAHVASFSRNAQQVAETVSSLRKHGGKVFGEAFKMSATAPYESWLERACNELGGLDIFVHNVSSSGAGGGADRRMTFELLGLGAVRGTQAVLPFLEKSDAASVIFMSSTAATETFFSPNAFNSLKAALFTYSKQLSQAWGPKGIRVNTVTPGPITFPGGNWTKIEQAKPEVYAATVAKTVFGRLGTADEVARTVVFIASPASSFTTGANIVIDGGYTKRVQF